MVRQLLILACLLGLNLSVVVCREDHDHRPHFSDFMSHHHRRSTPGEIIPSTEVPVELVSGGPTPKPAVAVKTGGEHVGEPQHGETTFVLEGSRSTVNIIIIVSIVIGVLLCLLCIGVTFFFAKNCCIGMRPGIVLRKPAENSAEMQPQKAQTALLPQPTPNNQESQLRNALAEHRTQPSEHLYPQPTPNSQGSQLQNVQTQHMTSSTQQLHSEVQHQY